MIIMEAVEAHRAERTPDVALGQATSTFPGLISHTDCMRPFQIKTTSLSSLQHATCSDLH
jgi:hypothetical protein